jgi:hypothetical protein
MIAKIGLPQCANTGRQGPLVAVLLNPPGKSSGTRTRNATARAARVLGYDSHEIVNLCLSVTVSVTELNDIHPAEGWLRAQPALAGAVRGAGSLLGAWGVAGLAGSARRRRDDQVRWLYAEAFEHGFRDIWMVGGEPRHPSRWHQYVSDKYGRTVGGNFEERLAQVIVRHSFVLA